MALACLLVAGVVLSSVHPWGDLRTVGPSGVLLEGAAVPSGVRDVFEAKCADCHSQNTHWPLYSRVAPASWLVEHDVHAGRSHLNLSRWPSYSADEQVDLLSRIASEIRQGEMPVKQYLILHPQARLSADEQQLIYDWAKGERKRIRKELAEQPNQPPASEETKTP